MGVLRKDGKVLSRNMQGWVDFLIVAAFWGHRAQIKFNSAHDDSNIIIAENERIITLKQELQPSKCMACVDHNI